jgi:hypothetical protein
MAFAPSSIAILASATLPMQQIFILVSVIGLSVYRSIGLSVYRSIAQSLNRSIAQSLNQSVGINFGAMDSAEQRAPDK